MLGHKCIIQHPGVGGAHAFDGLRLSRREHIKPLMIAGLALGIALILFCTWNQ